MNRSAVMLGLLLLLASMVFATSAPTSASSASGGGVGVVKVSEKVIAEPINDLPPLPDEPSIMVFTINIKPGWNMISFPYLSRISYGTGSSTPTINIVENSCDSKQIIHYNGVNYEYADLSKATSSTPFSGYWFKSKTNCKISIAAMEQATPSNLIPGWNQIGAPAKNVVFEKIKGNCIVTSGPWGFNTAANQYEKAIVLKPGEGYFVKVQAGCLLNDDELPPMPTDQIITPKPPIKVSPYPAGKPIILHRTIRDCATQRVLTQAESLRIDPNSQEYYGLKMDDSVSNIQTIDLRVFQGGNYWNAVCSNRYQEQCINDGSFDNYYEEWCVYA